MRYPHELLKVTEKVETLSNTVSRGMFDWEFVCTWGLVVSLSSHQAGSLATAATVAAAAAGLSSTSLFEE